MNIPFESELCCFNNSRHLELEHSMGKLCIYQLSIPESFPPKHVYIITAGSIRCIELNAKRTFSLRFHNAFHFYAYIILKKKKKKKKKKNKQTDIYNLWNFAEPSREFTYQLLIFSNRMKNKTDIDTGVLTYLTMLFCFVMFNSFVSKHLCHDNITSNLTKIIS